MRSFYKGKVPETYIYLRFLNKLKGKGISSLSTKENKNEKQDGRRDKDGDWGKKYKNIKEDGTV